MPSNPPQPLPEHLWGQQWRFATLSADAIARDMAAFPIPYTAIPADRLPLSQGLASTVEIPGLVIDAGRKALSLAQWIDQLQPMGLNVVMSELNGVILQVKNDDRWILATFQDADVQAAAQRYLTRRSLAKGLHFLLIQPDDTGMTYSGFWLLQSVELSPNPMDKP